MITVLYSPSPLHCGPIVASSPAIPAARGREKDGHHEHKNWRKVALHQSLVSLRSLGPGRQLRRRRQVPLRLRLTHEEEILPTQLHLSGISACRGIRLGSRGLPQGMTVRAETVVPVAVHHPKPLVIRGGLARTFGSLASFLAVLFLILGSYLLGDAIEHPLNAQAVAVLAAAFSITLSIILLYFLLKPRRGHRSRGGSFRHVE